MLFQIVLLVKLFTQNSSKLFAFIKKFLKADAKKKEQLTHDVFNKCEDPNGENNYIDRIFHEKTIANI